MTEKEMIYNSLSQKYSPILIARDVAEILALRETTVRTWTSKKKIPCVHMHGAVRYLLTDIIDWLLQQREQQQKQEVQAQVQ